MYIYENEVKESDFVPVANAEILAGNVFYTDNAGKAVFTLESEPPLVISSGNNAVLISKKITTRTDLVIQNNFHFYPNPVENELIIEGLQDEEIYKTTLRLFTSGGQIVFEKEVNSNRQQLNFLHCHQEFITWQLFRAKKQKRTKSSKNEAVEVFVV
jgi:hypothetical protein